MRNNLSTDDKINVSDILSFVILSIFVMLGAIYYASCYYRNNNLVFTHEDSFIFTAIIIAIVVLAIAVMILSYIVFSLRKEVRNYIRMGIDQQTEIIRQIENGTLYTIESNKRIIEKIDDSSRCG